MKTQNPKKPLFIKRWIKRFLSWLDRTLFGMAESEETVTVAQPFWWTLVVAFWCGAVMFVWALFADKSSTDKILSIGAGVALVAGLAIAASYLYRTLGTFPTVGVKIFRSVYVVVLCLLGCLLGFFAAYAALFVLIGLFVLWVLYMAVFGDSKKGKGTVELEDGTRLTCERGACGEEYYTGSDGREYRRSGNTFTPKE